MIAGLEDISSGELWMDDCLMNMVEPKTGICPWYFRIMPYIPI